MYTFADGLVVGFLLGAIFASIPIVIWAICNGNSTHKADKVVENYGIITFPVSEEFDTIETANKELKQLQLLL